MDWRRQLRNWLWPTVLAMAAAAATAYQQGCMEATCMMRPALSAGVTLLLAKFNPIGGKDQKWFSHDDGIDPHRA